ncbi:MAG: transposase family protein [Nitrospira sp.]|nr:transposase family protein [Nitrospira sp.]
MDFGHDQLVDGQRFKILTVMDTYTRMCPILGVGTGYRGSDVVDALEQATAQYGRPKCIRVDNGPEFVSRELDLWAYQHGIELDFPRPGKPTDNAFVEAFNGQFRLECLNQHWFGNMSEARDTIEGWRVEYNRDRPHGSRGNLTPWEFLQQAHGSSS